MTRVRFLVAMCGAVLLAPAPAGAAPIPKGAGKNDPTPDLNLFFDTAAKAVKVAKWPVEAEEKKLKGTARVAFERMLKAARQKERKLPVDFAKLKKVEPAAAFKQTGLVNGFVIAGDVRITLAKDSVIFASGDVQITSASNCVIVARNVRVTGVDNCFVAADEFIRLTSARRRDGGDPSVLLSGQWIRTTSMDGTICHVLRPGALPSPDEARLPPPYLAIRTNGAKGVIYLNDLDDTYGSNPDQQTYLPQKTPIAK